MGLRGVPGKSGLQGSLRLPLGWGGVLFVVYLGARPSQRCLQGKGDRGWADAEEQLACSQEGQKIQLGHSSMILFSQNLLVIYLEAARNKTPHGLQHTSLSCPSLSPGVCLNSCSLNQ